MKASHEHIFHMTMKTGNCSISMICSSTLFAPRSTGTEQRDKSVWFENKWMDKSCRELEVAFNLLEPGTVERTVNGKFWHVQPSLISVILWTVRDIL